MIIGLLRLEFTLHGNDSLKGKRKVASSLKMKLRNKFNVAAAEIEAQDEHTRLVLGAVTVGSDAAHIEGLLRKALSMAEAATSEELTDSDIEVFQA